MSTVSNEVQAAEDAAGDKLATEFNELFNKTLKEFGASGLSVQTFFHHMVATCQAGMIGTARVYAEALAYSHPDENMETIKSETSRIVQQYTSNFAESLNHQLDVLAQQVEAMRPQPKEKEE